MPVTSGPYFYDGRLLLGTNIPLTNETPPPHSIVIGSHNGNAVYSEGNISMISGNFVVGALSCSSNNYQMEINGNVNVTGSYFQNGLPILTNLLAPNVARAWAHFSLTDNVISIYDSYNVSSIDYNGSGIFTISFSESLSSANYALIGSVGYEVGDDKPYIVQEATHQPNYRTTNKIIVIIPGLVGSRTRISVAIF